ncbi:hypothetical protein [Granulicella arctica]|uniref:Uncharacterized protein n=1 Tax=Granulicella arctica TaxID=940613 RepID=A0A7Y9PE84_9BACT|nr:hypothetical protein [Granulicella arctica]NYF78307.1 hypothetical protein [Granulicella arctica]
MSESSVSYLWREQDAAKGFAAGVSLHSHTNQSRETLDFIADLTTGKKMLQGIMQWAEDRCVRTTGIRPDYRSSYWTPPLTPRLAFDLERSQIEQKTELPALVSITDHDDIKAPLLLRSIESARHIPVSVEWTVPFAETAFHLGVHNLPSAKGAEWMERLQAFTAMPVATRPARLVTDMLAELDEIPGVLLIFNHPNWDLYQVGQELHNVRVNDFLAVNGQFIHALELNGLRNWKENQEVSKLAKQWNQIVISGGDRHGVEPNANINLTHATSFTEFVHEVRRERKSHVLFMPQYRQPWKHRILQSTLDAIRNYPEFPEGSKRWDERVYHPDAMGVVRPLSTLWKDGHCPHYLEMVLRGVRMMGAAPVSGGLRLAWDESSEMRAAMRSAIAD